MNELITKHELYFDSPTKMTPRALADSLIGLEGVVERSVEVMRKMFPELGDFEDEILMAGIEIGSYKDKFWFRLLFGKDEEAEERIDDIRKKYHLDGMTTQTIVGLLIGGVLVWGVMKFSGGGPATTTNIEARNSFNEVAVELKMTGEELAEFFEKTERSSEPLKRDIVRLVRPGEDPKDGTLILKGADGDIALELSPAALAAVPLQYEKPDRPKPEEELLNVPIIVRALDLDRPGQGWAAILPELDERRLALKLDDGVDPMSLPVGKIFYADVTVIHSVDKHGNRKPKSYVLTAVVEKP